MSTAEQQLMKLQQRRARPGRDVSINGTVTAIARDAARIHKKHGELINLWEELVPNELAQQTTIVSLRGGIGQVQVTSAAAGFELDRMLRGGLLVQLRTRFSGTLSRIKVKVGEVG